MSALQKWNGGVILISHDERFITTVAREVYKFRYLTHTFLTALQLWVCGDRTVTKFTGDVQAYKASGTISITRIVLLTK